MPPIPANIIEPTLAAMNEQIAKKAKREVRRLYLGMSSIGRECSREQWYNFRWVGRVEFGATTLKNFEDGHRTEDLYAERLRSIPGVTLITADPVTGRQIGFSDFGGHYRGHMDGHIEGILQSPKTPHVWEHKATNTKKFNLLKKLCAELGEKRALMAWDFTYWAQQISYLDFGGYSRSYLTASTPGGRDDTSVRTDADPKSASLLRDKAEKIIFSDEPPAKISEKAEYYQCKWCDWSEYCHQGKAADRNCRTCMHSTVRREGGWMCAKYQADLNADAQAQGCSSHRYNPYLVPGEVVDGSTDENWMEYDINGTEWRDNG